MWTIGFQHQGLFGPIVHRVHGSCRMSLKAGSINAFFRSLASGKLVQSLYDAFLFEVDGDRRARFGHRQPFRKTVDSDDLLGTEQHRTPYCHLTDWAAAPDRNGVCRLDVA